MNLHIFQEDLGVYSKYATDRILKAQESDNNLFVNLAPAMIHANERLVVINPSEKEMTDYIDGLPEIDKIICHPYNAFTKSFVDIYISRRPKPVIYWCCWSGEIYNLPSNYPKLLERFSLNIYRERFATRILKKNFFWGRQLLSKLLLKLFTLKHTLGFEKTFIQSFDRIDTFFSLQKEDHDYLMKISGHKFPIKHLYFNYISSERFRSIPHSGEVTEVMVGHSCALEANQYELLVHLKKIGIPSKLYMPISYGDKELSEILNDQALRLFGNQIFVQLNDMPPDEYYNQLGRIGYAIFNVKVQQGLGNILGLVYAGKKVFIREESSIYKDLKKRGAFVFSTNRDLTLAHLTHPLTESERMNNREIIEEMISEERIQEYWKYLS